MRIRARPFPSARHQSRVERPAEKERVGEDGRRTGAGRDAEDEDVVARPEERRYEREADRRAQRSLAVTSRAAHPPELDNRLDGWSAETLRGHEVPAVGEPQRGNRDARSLARRGRRARDRRLPPGRKRRRVSERCSRDTTRANPTPMLNVWYISSSEIEPRRCTKSKTGGTAGQSVEHERDPVVEPHEVPHASTAQVGEPVGRGPRRDGVRNAGIDAGGDEEFHTDRNPRARARLLEVDRGFLEKFSNQRESVRMQAVRGDPEDDVLRSDPVPGHRGPVAREEAEGRPTKVDPSNDRRHDRGLASEERTARRPEPAVDPPTNRAKDLGVGAGAEDRVDQSCRPGRRPTRGR